MRSHFLHGLTHAVLLLLAAVVVSACQGAAAAPQAVQVSPLPTLTPASSGEPSAQPATQLPAVPQNTPAPTATGVALATPAPSAAEPTTSTPTATVPPTTAPVIPQAAPLLATPPGSTPVTPTVGISSTVMPTATAGVTVTSGTPVAAGSSSVLGPDVLYHDDFTNPGSGWPDEVVFENYYVGYHEPDNYHVEVHVQNDSAVVDVPGRTFDNFSAETQAMAAKSNTAPTGDFRYGLTFRQAGKRYYAFTISPRTKTWYVLKSSPTGLQVLAQGTQDSIQGLQALDTLRVNAQGPQMTFFVNNQAVSQLSDADYTDGALGLYVETFDSPKAHIHFHDLTIRKPQSIASAPKPPSVCQVSVDLLRLRPEPSLAEQPPIAGLFRGTQLDALGRTPDSSWVRVQIHGANQVGWVSAQDGLISCNVAISSLPVAQTSPPSTPTAP